MAAPDLIYFETNYKMEFRAVTANVPKYQISPTWPRYKGLFV